MAKGKIFSAIAPSYRQRREREGLGGPLGSATGIGVELDRQTPWRVPVSHVLYIPK
jgi:hypothetical protein